MKRNIYNPMFVLMILLSTSCCKNDYSDNKIIVKEYDPMVIYDRNNPYSIDINLDGTNDIQAYFFDHSGYGEDYFKSFNINSCWVTKGDWKQSGSVNIIKLDTINERLTWMDATPFSFSDENDYYLGVKMIKNDSVYYGWVLPKYIHTATDQYKQGTYIYKTAFCKVPNYEILAGQEELYLE